MYRYVSFDLDNTLYSYDDNSRDAVEKVFDMLQTEHGLSGSDLWSSYVEFIKRIPGPKLFSDGRSSFEYRFERFSEILKMYDVNDEDVAKRCVDIYSNTMLDGMKPFPGVIETAALRALSLRVTHLEELVSEMLDRSHAKSTAARAGKQLAVSLVALGITVLLWIVWIVLAATD